MVLSALDTEDGAPHSITHGLAVHGFDDAVVLAVDVNGGARGAVVVIVDNGRDVVLGDDVGDHGTAGDDLHCYILLIRWLYWIGEGPQAFTL